MDGFFVDFEGMTGAARSAFARRDAAIFAVVAIFVAAFEDLAVRPAAAERAVLLPAADFAGFFAADAADGPTFEDDRLVDRVALAAVEVRARLLPAAVDFGVLFDFLPAATVRLRWKSWFRSRRKRLRGDS